VHRVERGDWPLNRAAEQQGTRMTRVITSKDCGNSPKNIFLQKLTVAFARDNTRRRLGSVSDDIRWDIVGKQSLQGTQAFARALARVAEEQAAVLTIHQIASHGRAGAVNGTLKMKDGSTRAFCDVYEFANAKGDRVKEITSYIITI
jgi:hypothetical protein